MKPKPAVHLKTEITYCDIFPESFFFREIGISVYLEYARGKFTTATTWHYDTVEAPKIISIYNSVFICFLLQNKYVIIFHYSNLMNVLIILNFVWVNWSYES